MLPINKHNDNWNAEEQLKNIENLTIVPHLQKPRRGCQH